MISKKLQLQPLLFLCMKFKFQLQVTYKTWSMVIATEIISQSCQKLDSIIKKIYTESSTLGFQMNQLVELGKYCNYHQLNMIYYQQQVPTLIIFAYNRENQDKIDNIQKNLHIIINEVIQQFFPETKQNYNLQNFNIFYLPILLILSFRNDMIYF
ncbi:hypothetical protein ABPG74_021299 [Tetrahymena malaccensis]